MFVNTNVAALNAWRNLENTQNDMTGVLQQMSSGYRINTAADDPAGLAITQQMQSQIGGLNQAYQNSQSGVSLLQTADGALGQIQNILQSMRSLASEASTATMNPTDTQNLQTEMNQYAQEVTQITNTTQFNNINLLGGNFTNQSIQVGANQNQNLDISMGAADAFSLGVTGQTATFTGGSNTYGNVVQSTSPVGISGLNNDSYTLAAAVTPFSFAGGGTTPTIFNAATVQGSNVSVAQSDTATVTITTAGAAGTSAVISVNDPISGTSTYTATATGTASTFNNVMIGGNSFTLGNVTTGTATSATITLNPTSTQFTLTDSGSGASATTTVHNVVTAGQTEAVSLGNGSLSFGVGSVSAAETSAAYTATFNAGGTSTTTPAPGALTSAVFGVSQSGTGATSYNNGTGNGTATTGVNILTQSAAQSAITVIDNAINTLSSERANVGAYQNRLQFASNDVQTTTQNLTAARGGIMDADMAKEMSNLSKDQVLMQAGVGMLAQANQVPQMLLKMLP